MTRRLLYAAAVTALIAATLALVRALDDIEIGELTE